jgi:20S proteasome alpha/beta subunit
MITSGDVEFELVGRSVAQRPILKALKISETIGIMTAGDAGFQADAVLDLARRLNGNRHPTVRQVASLYLDFVNESKQRAATNRILSPLGLNTDTFISRQREMNDDFVQRITSEMLRIELGAETIFAGLDETGAHIYTVNEHGFQCQDSIAFAAIGYGARHAESQFMLAKHSRNAPARETILLTYIAKKRSEIAPGVGRETDMFWISAREGFNWIHQANIEKLQSIYETLEQEQYDAFGNADTAWRAHLEEIDKRTREEHAELKAQPLKPGGKKVESQQEKPQPSAPSEQNEPEGKAPKS